MPALTFQVRTNNPSKTINPNYITHVVLQAESQSSLIRNTFVNAKIKKEVLQ